MPYLVPAMTNIFSAFAKCSLVVKVSPPIALNSLNTSYPPLRRHLQPRPRQNHEADVGTFSGGPNPRPCTFFAYIADIGDIPLDYALFRANASVIDPASSH